MIAYVLAGLAIAELAGLAAIAYTCRAAARRPIFGPRL